MILAGQKALSRSSKFFSKHGSSLGNQVLKSTQSSRLCSFDYCGHHVSAVKQQLAQCPMGTSSQGGTETMLCQGVIKTLGLKATPVNHGFDYCSVCTSHLHRADIIFAGPSSKACRPAHGQGPSDPCSSTEGKGLQSNQDAMCQSLEVKPTMLTYHFGIHWHHVLDMLDILDMKSTSQGLCAMQACHSPRASGQQRVAPYEVRPARCQYCR